MSVMDTENILNQLHSDKLKELVPVIVIIVVLMIVGLAGNVSVFLFYWKQPKRSSTTFFILVLTVTDTLVCLAMALELTDVANTYVFKNDVACQFYMYANHIAALLSGFILVIIATDRYRKLCQPLKKQLTLIHAKIICVVCLTVSLLVSLPVFFLYGTTSVYIPVNNFNVTLVINGSDCTTKPEIKGIEKIVHYVFLGIFCLGTMILVILYSMIGRVIYRYRKNHKHFKRDLQQANAQDHISTSGAVKASDNVESNPNSVSRTNTVGSNDLPETNDKMSAIEDNVEQTNVICTAGNQFESSKANKVAVSLATNPKTRFSSSSSNNSCDTLSRDADDKRKNRKYRKTIAAMKMTIMLFIITVIFVASFVPYQVVSVLEHEETVAFELALRSYLLNSVVNPFVYGLFNVEFRRKFKGVMCRVWVKCISSLLCNKTAEGSNLPEVHNFDDIK